jgi:pimeloyl-ACP methyl ester carboxylesterase
MFALTTNLVPGREEAIAAWTAIRQSRPVRAGNAFRQLVAAARYRAPPAAPVPTLVLASAGDHLVDTRCSLEIARRWGCSLAVHPEAGHDLPLDDGLWVACVIRAWDKGR